MGRPNPRRRIDWRPAAGAVGAIVALACLALPAAARSQARTALVSVNAAGEPANASVRRPSVSADGRRVAFDSTATNLVAGGPPGVADVFVRDLLTGEIRKMSVSSAGVDGNGHSTHPSISASGRFVAFRSTATNLVPGDTNDAGDVFVHDLATGETRRVSVGPAGREANGGSGSPSILANGRPSISANGGWVAFTSDATNLIRLDLNGVRDIFVRNWATGKTRLVSRSSRGAQANRGSRTASISGNGRVVAFESRARNLVGGRTNAATHVYIRNLRTGKTRRVSKSSAGVQGNGGSGSPSVSGNGRVIAFDSCASNLVRGASCGDVFIRNRKTGKTRRVSVSSRGVPGKGDSFDPAISAAGLRVVFESKARNLVPGDTNRHSHIYLRDRRRGNTRRVSVSSDGEQADGLSFEAAISGDGRWAAFSSGASNLVAGDSGARVQVFSRGPLR